MHITYYTAQPEDLPWSRSPLDTQGTLRSGHAMAGAALELVRRRVVAPAPLAALRTLAAGAARAHGADLVRHNHVCALPRAVTTGLVLLPFWSHTATADSLSKAASAGGERRAAERGRRARGRSAGRAAHWGARATR